MSHRKMVVAPALEEVRTLLEEAALPFVDIDMAALQHFIAVRVGGQVAGIAGLEPCAPDGLLRSVVVRDASRGAGLGRRLVGEAERRAAALGIETLYLLTDTAADYFRRLGFDDCPRDAAPRAIRNTREFSALCPDTAAFMRKAL